MTAAAAVCLSACGGGGGGSRPATSPPPPPAPPPPPTPPPGSSAFDDAEYRASAYAVAAKALSAYDRGATGQGAKISIIDSGINATSPEFAGRVDPASTGLTDDTGHGTAVAQIAAGARNGSGTLGVAFNSAILSIDTLTCQSGDCFHRLNDVAAAIDFSVANGADVINLSQVGPNSNAAVSGAIDRATRAGSVVVIAAGNSGAANPDGFALQNAAAGNGALIIAGAYVGSTLVSSAAGVGRDNFLAAYGGTTSESTPVISGAAALLAAAFPNLTGTQIVSILFASADDAGAPGVDDVWGRGILNIAKAFQPSGTASFAGTAIKLDRAGLGTTSGPLGDFAARTGPRAIVLDAYSRTYSVDVGKMVQQGAIDLPMFHAASGQMRGIETSLAPQLTFAMSFRNPAQRGTAGLAETLHPASIGFAALASLRPTTRTQIALAKGYGSQAIHDHLAGSGPLPFIAAREPSSPFGSGQVNRAAIGVKQRRSGMTAIATAVTGLNRSVPGRPGSFSEAGISLTKPVGPSLLQIGGRKLSERGTILGARLGDVLGSSNATSLFADFSASLSFGRWSVSSRYTRGWTSFRGGGGLIRSGHLSSDSFAADLASEGLTIAGDRLAIRIARPLRVRSGGSLLVLPTSFDYSTGQATTARKFMLMVPLGRELDLETSYGRPFLGGWLSANIFVRKQPGNIASLPVDAGGLLRFSLLR